MYPVKLFLKLETALLIGPNCPISSLMRIFYSESFGFWKIASSIAPQTWHLPDIQIWRVVRWPLFLFNHLQTFLRGIVEQHVQCTQSPMRLAESTAWAWQQLVALFNELPKQKSQFPKMIPLKLRQSLSCKADFAFCWNEWEFVNSKLDSPKSSGSCI